jgi:hypothetical protein
VARKGRKPVSRAGNSWFARVYRAEWTGPRSFADSKYGGREEAEAAAYRWVVIAEERLPIIPSKPVLRKASAHLRADPKSVDRAFFDVYLPALNGKTWTTKKFYFVTKDTEEKRRQERVVNSLVANQNLLLTEAHKKAMAKWERDHDRIMAEISEIWKDIRNMEV